MIDICPAPPNWLGSEPGPSAYLYEVSTKTFRPLGLRLYNSVDVIVTRNLQILTEDNLGYTTKPRGH